MKQEYTVNYFIKKFEAIPEKLWCVEARVKGNQRCALGWCYPDRWSASRSQTDWGNDSDEDKSLSALVRLLNPMFGAGGINNGIYNDYNQPTPKQRVLAALYDIKKIQEEQVGKEKPPIQYENAIPEILKSIQNPTVETDVLIQPKFEKTHIKN